jgi:hypothetical protein
MPGEGDEREVVARSYNQRAIQAFMGAPPDFPVPAC